MKRKTKITFDIDVALIKVWKEKRDERTTEANTFFKFLDSHKKLFLTTISKHTISLIKEWEHKILVQRLENLFEKYTDKTLDSRKLVQEFAFKHKKSFDEISSEFSKKAGIKHEDAVTMIIYSLLGVEYFITFNKKHLRNNYEEIKTTGWLFGLEIPEIILPHEFLNLFKKRFSS